MQIISKDAFDFNRQAKNLFSVQGIALAGLFMALYIILSNFNIRISSVLEIRWAFLMLAGAGLFGGPLMGIVVGAGADIISTIMTGQAFFFGFTFSYALLGCMFGLIFYRKVPNIPRSIAGSIVDFLVSMFINTLWLSLMYGSPYGALFVSRIPKCVVMLFVDAVLLYIVLGVLQKVLASLRMQSFSMD